MKAQQRSHPRAARLLAFTCMALSGCIDFDQALAQCTAQDRCTEPDGGRRVLIRFATVFHSDAGELSRLDAPEATMVVDATDGGSFAPAERDAGLAVFVGAPARFGIRATVGGEVLGFDSELERLDLTTHVAGRPDAVRADAGTQWRFDATGLVAGGGLHAVVAGTGVAQDLGFARDGGSVALDWAGLPVSNDLAFVTQRGSRLFVDDAGAAYDQSGIARVASGAAFSATLAFAPPPVVSFTVDWRRDAFRTLGPHPDATLAGSSFTLSASVFGAADAGVTAAENPFGAQPFAAEVLALRPRAQTGDLSATVDFPQPYPPQWPLVVTAVQRFRLAHVLPDGGESVGFSVVRRVEAAGGTVQPALELPTDAAIAGFVFTAAQKLPNDHPLVSWKAPAGTNLRYTLTVFRLEPDGTRTVAAVLHTPRTAVRIPSGPLLRGRQYVLELATRSTGSAADAEREPFAFRLPVSENTLVSGLLLVP